MFRDFANSKSFAYLQYKAIEKQINKQSELFGAKMVILEAIKNNKAITLQELEKLLLD